MMKTKWRKTDILKDVWKWIFHIFTTHNSGVHLFTRKRICELMLQPNRGGWVESWRVCKLNGIGALLNTKVNKTSNIKCIQTQNSQQHFTTWCEWLYKISERAPWISFAPRQTHSFAIQRITWKPKKPYYRFEFAWYLFELYFSQFY